MPLVGKDGGINHQVVSAIDYRDGGRSASPASPVWKASLPLLVVESPLCPTTFRNVMLMGVEERTERRKGHPCSAGAGFKSEFDMHAALKGKTNDLSLRQKMRPVTREGQMGKMGIPGRTVSSSKGPKGQVGGEKKHHQRDLKPCCPLPWEAPNLQVSHSFSSQLE